MRNFIASHINLMSMRRRGVRNGTSWTSRLITAEWDSPILCGNSLPLTKSTRSVSYHQWPVILWYPLSDLTAVWLCCYLFKGEWYLPSWPVCAWVSHTSSHSRKLQVQKQRPISNSVLLLQRKQCKLVTQLDVRGQRCENDVIILFKTLHSTQCYSLSVNVFCTFFAIEG